MILFVFSVVVGFCTWFMLYGFTCAINGSNKIFKCFIQDLLWVLPGARKRKGDYIRTMMSGWPEGSIDGFMYSEIREKDLYEYVGDLVLPGIGSFIVNHVFIPLAPMFCVYLLHRLIQL